MSEDKIQSTRLRRRGAAVSAKVLTVASCAT